MEDSLKRHLSYQLCTIIAALGACTGAIAGTAEAAGIGTILDVVNEGYRTPPGADERDARPADEVVQDEMLRTEDKSTISMKFVDGSELSVEASSEVVLSDYIYDGQASAGLIDLNGGLFHFTSNGKNDQGVKLRTPIATIGIRGTEFLVHVNGSKATVVDILSGAVEAIPHGKGKAVTCIAGQSILVAGPDEDALCGDLGSFTTAVGTREDRTRPEPGHGGQNHDKPEHVRPEPPQPDPDPDEGGGSSTMLLHDEEGAEWNFG